MTERSLYLAAYDIAHPRRLRRTLAAIKPFARGGQKSVYECLLTDSERTVLLGSLQETLDAEEDAFMLLRLDPRSRVVTLGKAVERETSSIIMIN